MITWSPTRKVATRLRNVSLICWLACLLFSAKFVGAPDKVEPGFEMLLFVGVFPLFFGAVIILQSRLTGAAVVNWVPVLLRSLPKEFSVFYRAYFFAVWLLSLYLMLRPMLQMPQLPKLGVSVQIIFVLIPSVFYLTSAGAYWSAAAEAPSER